MSGRRAVLGVLASLVLAGCVGPPPTFVEGPEATDLAARVTGHLVLKQGRDTTGNDPRILVLALPGRERAVVRRYARKDAAGLVDGWIRTVSGPDHAGRIAFVEELGFQSAEYAVKSIRVDGSAERELFRRRGKGIDTTLSLSPSGRRIAYVGTLTGRQMGGALLQTGPLEIWDETGGAPLRFDGEVLDDPASWFPDEARLALNELVPRTALAAEVEAGRRADLHFLDGVEHWPALPVVSLLDVRTGAKTFVHVGWRPLVSTDGRTVLFRWGAYRLFDVETRTFRRVRWPGSWRPPIALLPEGLVIYPGLPTRGAKVRRIEYGSFSTGSPLGSIKIVDLATGRFQTLVEYADPRETFSFGPAPPSAAAPPPTTRPPQ